MKLIEIEQITRRYAAVRRELEELVTDLQEEVGKLRRARMAAIKRALEKTGEAHTSLFHAIEDNPELFQKPKSLLLAGVVVGYRKERDRLEWRDNEAVGVAVKEHLPALYAALVEVKQHPLRKALMLLGAETLKTLGITLDRGKDRVIIENANSEIDKLIQALVREAEQETGSAG